MSDTEMRADIHAILLLGMIIGTAVVLVTCRRRKVSACNLAAALPGIGYLFLVSLAMSAHRCNSGSPVHQLVIGVACFVPISVFVERKVLRRSVVAVVLVLSTFLSNDFVELVHAPNYTGNRKGVEPMPIVLPESAHDIDFVAVKPTWHTRITGLYIRQANRMCVTNALKVSYLIVTNSEAIKRFSHCDSAWMPSRKEIEPVNKALAAYLDKALAAETNQNVIDDYIYIKRYLSNYFREYAGVIRHGRKQIVCQMLHVPERVYYCIPDNQMADAVCKHDAFLMISDGGAAVVHFWYDVKKHDVTDLSWNGDVGMWR